MPGLDEEEEQKPGYRSVGAPLPPAVAVDPLDPNPVAQLGLPATPAAPAPAMPGGDLTPDQLALAATVPDAAPGLGPKDPVDQVLADNPVQAPPKPSTPPLPPGPVNVADQERQNLNQGAEITDAKVAAEQKAGGARRDVAQAEADAADKQAGIAEQGRQDNERALASANQATQQWWDAQQQAIQRHQGMQLHDYFSDKSTGDRILAKLSVLFGAAGRTDNSHNPGLIALNDDIERNFRMQQANIAKAKEDILAAKYGYEGALSAKQQALADNKLRESAAYDAVAAKLVSLKMRAGVSLADAQTDASVQALREKGLEKRQEVLQAIHSQNVADARLKIDQERANAYAAKMGRGKGGGSGGGGGGAAATQWLQWAEANPKATETERAQMADKLHIPHDAKAGRTSLKTLEGELAGRAKGDASGAKGDEAMQARAIKDPNTGEFRGLVPTGKNVKDFQKQAIAYDQAKRSIEALLKSGAIIPKGHLWDNAVLAVASSTTLNPTESTKEHEAGTLKGRLGFISKEALLSKLDDIETRQKQFYTTLETPPQGFTMRTSAPPAPAGGGSAPGKTLPGGMKIVKVRDNQTGAIIEALKRPDGTLLDKQTGQPLQ